MQIHEAVRNWRNTNKLTQQEVANAIKMPQSQYARLEGGKYGFKAEHIKQIATTYNVSADILLGIV